MSLLADHRWRARYDPDDGPLAAQFYVPALGCAQRYDRITGYFNAAALAVAARGVEALVLNSGRMRLVVGCTLDQGEVQAMERGASLRDTVQAALLKNPLVAERGGEPQRALELLAWMVARGYLEVKVAVPCNEQRAPVAGTALFHPKAGIVEDKTGARLAFSGSVNETAQGWLHNWESFHVFCDWNGGVEHVEAEERSFAQLWADRAKRARVLDVPAAVRDSLLRFLPDDDREPERLRRAHDRQGAAPPADESPVAPPAPLPPNPDEQRRAVWGCIWGSPALPEGLRIAEATSAVVPWPHQRRAFRRMVDTWPPRLLIADEVGLGKTIEAGMLLRWAWLARRAKRVLVLAPKALLTQWQIELREKFNLNWPIYDGRCLRWYPSPAWIGRHEREVGRGDWHREPFVIASSHLMRRRDRQRELLEDAEPWDLVVLDEAHHARHNSPGAPKEGPPNLLLSLMQRLARRTQGLLLLTATPMQVHPVEVHDLLTLLGLPPEWSRAAFVDFFRRAADPNPSPEVFEQLARLFQAAERAFGETPLETALRRTSGNRLRAQRVLRVLRDPSATPRRQLSADDRRAALALLRARTPVATLVSRHTRDLLREYRRRGVIATPIATREVVDEFLEMSEAEDAVYVALEDYISTTYNAAAADQRSAVGFVMTIYRKRLASSLYALRRTLEERLVAVQQPTTQTRFDATRLTEDAEDDETDEGDAADDDTAAQRERQALQAEERGDIEALLVQVRRLAADTKARRLVEVLRALRSGSFRCAHDGALLPAYPQAIVFTQYTDTLDWLREHLRGEGFSILCFSGRGGEWLRPDGTWQTISREETRRRFRKGDADVLVCTDAAAEGLNFQFCGALVNFDMPWNPMRVEQRIGRVDRLGQQFERIAIINLLYEGTVETDVYRALRQRISLFTSVVGKLQPILSAMPTRLTAATLAAGGQREQARTYAVDALNRDIDEAKAQAFDLDEIVDAALEADPGPKPAYDLDTLNRLLDHSKLLPDGVEAKRNGSHELFWTEPGRAQVAVTCDAAYYEENAESVELWSPGGGGFPAAGEETAGEVARRLDELF